MQKIHFHFIAKGFLVCSIAIVFWIVHVYAASCPFHIQNDPYPGQCGRYIDDDQDGYCDHGAPDEPVVKKDAPVQDLSDGTQRGGSRFQAVLMAFPELHMHLLLFLLVGLFLLFITKNKRGKTKVGNCCDAHIGLLFIPLIGIGQYFLLENVLEKSSFRGYGAFWFLWFLLISRPLLNLMVYYHAPMVFKRFLAWIVAIRKQLGIAMFWFAFFHTLMWLIQWWKVDVLFESLVLNTMGFVGLISVLATFLAYITSNTFSMHLLGRNWKTVQMLSYLAFLTAVIHIYLVNSQRGIWVIGFCLLWGIVWVWAASIQGKKRHINE